MQKKWYPTGSGLGFTTLIYRKKCFPFPIFYFQKKPGPPGWGREKLPEKGFLRHFQQSLSVLGLRNIKPAQPVECRHVRRCCELACDGYLSLCYTGIICSDLTLVSVGDLEPPFA
jgi:hypothetical protein